MARAAGTSESGSAVNAVAHSTIEVHRDHVTDLVARAVARTRFPWLGFSDPTAEMMLEALDIDDSRYDDLSLRRALVPTIVVDTLVRDFFERHRDGLALSVMCGLCTRFWRVDNGQLRWIDVDAPPIAQFKAPLQPTCERHAVASSCSFDCEGWLRCLREARDVPTLIVAQGMGRRVDQDELDRFFESASEHLATGVEIIVDYDARRPLRPSSLRDAACLELPRSDGSHARYPRLRFAQSDHYPPELGHAVRGLNGLSRLFHGRGMPSIAHVRVV